MITTLPHVEGPGFGYPGPISFILPNSDVTAVVFYIHGWQDVCGPDLDTPLAVSEAFNLYPQLPNFDSGLIIPLGQGSGLGYSLNSTLAPHFGAFIRWALAYIQKPKADVYVAGHSAGGQVISSGLATALDFGVPVKGIVLLDATYGSNEETWGTIIKKYPGINIQNVYRPDSGTEGLSHYLSRFKEVTTHRAGAHETHCQIPSIYFGKLLQECMNGDKVT